MLTHYAQSLRLRMRWLHDRVKPYSPKIVREPKTQHVMIGFRQKSEEVPKEVAIAALTLTRLLNLRSRRRSTLRDIRRSTADADNAKMIIKTIDGLMGYSFIAGRDCERTDITCSFDADVRAWQRTQAGRRRGAATLNADRTATANQKRLVAQGIFKTKRACGKSYDEAIAETAKEMEISPGSVRTYVRKTRRPKR